MKLNIGLTRSGRFELPDVFLLRSAVIYGAPESGKTTTATVIAEEAWRTVHIPFVALDPKGDWWGVKSSRDGKSAGIPAIIFGGDHADLPLDETAAALIAGVVARLEQPVIIDLEHLSKGKQIRFVAIFLEKLYELNRRPRLLIADEAQRWAPQKPISPDHTICLGAAEDVAKLGRKHGLGRLFVTQRGAGFNKEVAELMDVMIAHRTPGVLDQERVREWLQANMGRLAVDDVMGAKNSDQAPIIAGLRKGEIFIASAHPDMKLFERVQVRDRTTFDSSATPEMGKKRSEPKVLAQPDLEVLRTEMADSIQRAKQDDPKELRRQLAEAHKQVALLKRELETPVQTRVEERVVEVAVIPETLKGTLTHILKFTQDLISTAEAAKILHERIETDLHEVSKIDGQKTLVSRGGVKPADPESERTLQPRAATTAPGGRHLTIKTAPAGSSIHPDLRFPQKRILDALAWMEAIGYQGPAHWRIVAMLAQQSPKSSGFANNVSILRVNDFLEGSKGRGLQLTERGRRIAVSPDVPLTTEDLLNAIAGKLSYPQVRILRFLTRMGAPVDDSWEKVAAQTEQSPTSSGYANNVSVLRSMGLVSGNRANGLRAEDVVFLNGRK